MADLYGKMCGAGGKRKSAFVPQQDILSEGKRKGKKEGSLLGYPRKGAR